jgi:hypothetical protein
VEINSRTSPTEPNFPDTGVPGSGPGDKRSGSAAGVGDGTRKAVTRTNGRTRLTRPSYPLSRKGLRGGTPEIVLWGTSRTTPRERRLGTYSLLALKQPIPLVNETWPGLEMRPGKTPPYRTCRLILVVHELRAVQIFVDLRRGALLGMTP